MVWRHDLLHAALLVLPFSTVTCPSTYCLTHLLHSPPYPPLSICKPLSSFPVSSRVLHVAQIMAHTVQIRLSRLGI